MPSMLWGGVVGIGVLVDVLCASEGLPPSSLATLEIRMIVLQREHLRRAPRYLSATLNSFLQDGQTASSMGTGKLFARLEHRPTAGGAVASLPSGQLCVHEKRGAGAGAGNAHCPPYGGGLPAPREPGINRRKG